MLGATLQPAKFIFMILQLICMSVVWEVKDQHIYAGLSETISKTSDVYLAEQYKIESLVWLSYICLAVEFAIIFSGRTLFNDRYNMLCIGAHIAGVFATNLFLAGPGLPGVEFALVWGVGCALPLGVEMTSFMYSYFNYANKFDY